MVSAGAIYWPIGKARELLRAYRDWVAISPPEKGIEHPPISAIWRAGSTRTPPSPAAKSPEHVQDAVRLAADRRLSIRVQSTGHGALAASTGGMLIDTSTQYSGRCTTRVFHPEHNRAYSSSPARSRFPARTVMACS